MGKTPADSSLTGPRPLARATIPGRLASWLPEILLVLVTTGAGLRAAGRWLSPFGDPGFWWSLLWRMDQGEKCYRDVFIHYGPLSPFLLSLATRVFGLSARSFLLLNWVPAVLLGVLLVRASRPFLTTFERLTVLGLVLALGVFGAGQAQSRLVLSYSPAAVQALVLAVGALLFLQRTEVRAIDPFAAGILAGLAFCAKQEVGIAAIAGLCVPALSGTQRGGRWVVRSLAAFFAVASLGVLWVFSAASLDSLRHENHFWPVAALPASWKVLFRAAAGVSGGGWLGHVTWSALGLIYCILCIGLAAMILARDSRVKRGVLIVLLGGLLAGGVAGRVRLGWTWDPICLCMSVAFALALSALLTWKRSGRDFLVAFGLFAGMVAMRTAFVAGPHWNVYSGIANVSTAVTWALFLFCVVPAIFPAGPAAGEIARRIWAVALLPVALYYAWTSMDALRARGVVAVQTRQGRVWVKPEMTPFLDLLAHNLRPGENALILPDPNGIDALFGLHDASPYLSHMPGWLDARAEDILLRRFEENPPDVVIWFHRPTPEYGVDPLGQGFGKRLYAWIVQNFRVAAYNPTGMIFRRKTAS